MRAAVLSGMPAFVPVLAGVALLLALPWLLPSSYWIRIAGNAAIWVMLALGLNVTAGFAGLLDLGYIAFYAVGGYTYALLCSNHWGIHLPFLLAVPACALVASLFGWLLGGASLRLKGDYLAIVTLAFAQIARLLLLNLDRPVNITGGPNGLVDLDFASLFGFTFRTVTQYYYLTLAFAAITAAGAWRLKRSRLGRGWEAIREDELAAGVLGVNTTFMKLLAFALGATVAGAAGAIFASWQGGVFPNNFDFPQLVTVYCMLILGGTGSIPGVVLAAVILAVLPEALREYGEYRMIFYGLLLVVMMNLRPQGLLGGISWPRSKGGTARDGEESLKSAEELFYGEGSVDCVKPLSPGSLDPRCTLLEVEDLSMDFGGLTALSGLDFQVRRGEIVSLIGPNGAGKTTAFNLITGIYSPARGEIRFRGENIAGLKPYEVTRRGIARTFQSLRLFHRMTVLENAMVGRHCRTRSGLASILLRTPGFRREEADVMRAAKENLGLFGARLTGFRYGQRPLNLSYANRRRLEMARALATGCELLLLDEPSAGMNPKETEEITRFIRRLRDDYGIAVLVIEHKLKLVKDISDRVVVLDFGVKIAEGSYADITADEGVVEAYLGRKSCHV